MISTDFIEELEGWWTRQQITAGQRTQIYDTLAMLLENNVLLVDALTEMYDVLSDDRRKPNRPAAMMIFDCRKSVAEGHSLSAALATWVSREEAAIIAAGERSGVLRQSFQDAMALIEARKKIVSAIAGKVILTIMPLGVLCMLLHIVATKLVPSLQSAAPAETWTGSARLLYYAALFVNHFGAITLFGSIALVVAVILSFPRLTGNLRFRLDRLPPWSIYRTVVGAIALQNIAVLIRSGVKLHDALIFMASNATPYLQERLDAAIVGTTKGFNLGEALELSEYNFPDREAVKYIRLLASKDGFDQALTRFALAWIDTSVKKVQVAMNVFMYLSIFTVGACAVTVVDASSEIQGLIENNIQHASER